MSSCRAGRQMQGVRSAICISSKEGRTSAQFGCPLRVIGTRWVAAHTRMLWGERRQAGTSAFMRAASTDRAGANQRSSRAVARPRGVPNHASRMEGILSSSASGAWNGTASGTRNCSMINCVCFQASMRRAYSTRMRRSPSRRRVMHFTAGLM